MNLNRKEIKRIRGLILFAGLVFLALMKIDLIWQALVFGLQIVSPFLLGGAIAFVINLPMSFFERKLFPIEGKNSKAGKVLDKLKRPVSMLLAYVVVVLVIVLVIITVIPQLVETIKVLGKEIPVFLEEVLDYLTVVLAANPELVTQLQSIQISEVDWQKLLQDIFGFLQNGMGNMLSSTFSVASSIASGAVNFFVSLIFSVYVLGQKEKLANQASRLLQAYTKPEVCSWCMKVAKLLYRNFSNFITGQCTEAVILGAMFVIVMSVLRFPFAFMIGVLIAFTALIPVMGAFIGCGVGVFLILVDSPTKALGFLILFLVLQQIEGNLIYPHVVGNSVGLPSMWVLAAVTIGGSLMGVVGMLVFIPILSTVYILIKEDVNKRNESAEVALRKQKENIDKGKTDKAAISKAKAVRADKGEE